MDRVAAAKATGVVALILAIFLTGFIDRTFPLIISLAGVVIGALCIVWFGLYELFKNHR